MGTTKSFSTRLSLNILLIVSILFIVVLLIVAISSHILMTKEATKSATSILEANIAHIEDALHSIEINVKNEAWIAENHIGEDEYLKDVTRKIVERNSYIIGSAIACDSSIRKDHWFFSPYSFNDEDGTLNTKLLGATDDGTFDEEWYRVPYETGEPHWSEPYFDDGGGECLMVTYSYPLKDKDGKVYAIVTADMSLDWIDVLLKSIHPYTHSYATLATSQGRYLNKKDGRDYSKETIFTTVEKLNDENAKELVRRMVNGEKGTARITLDKQVSFSVFGPLYNGWTMSITCQYRDVLYHTSQMHMILIVVGLLGLLVMFIICYRIICHLTQPLTEFSVSAMNMAKGNFNAKLPEVKSRDEMRRLYDSFAYMQKSINTYIRELRATTSVNERMESELHIARSIQLGMLPKDFPHTDRCHLHALLYPAKEVGGDLYDFLVKDGYLYFTVGDVSGKGVPAALVMAITRAVCRFFSSMGLKTGQIASQLNNNVSENNDACMFATLFFGRLNLETLKLEICNAGHNPIIVIPADPQKAPYYYNAISNLAVGLMPDFPYQEESIDLEPGSKLLLYTDGVTEAETRQKELFGEDRLLAVVSDPEFRKLTPEEMTERVNAAVVAHADGNEQNDDITIMAISL